MGGTPSGRRRLSWRVNVAWMAASLASLGVFSLAGALLGGDDDPLGATVPVVGTATVFLAYAALCASPVGQPARVTVRALARVVAVGVVIGLVLGYVFHSAVVSQWCAVCGPLLRHED